MKFTKISMIIYFIILNLLNALKSTLENIEKKHLKSSKKNIQKNKLQSDDIYDQIDSTLNPKIESEDLPDVPIYHRGWMKYFHYKDNKEINKPKSFFRNDAYFLQKKYISKNEQLNKTDTVYHKIK